MKKVASILVALGMIFSITACSSGAEQPASTANQSPVSTASQEASSAAESKSSDKQMVIGFAQSRMNHPYRVAAVEEFKSAVKEKNLNWKVVVCDGQNDTAKQTADVEDLITQNVNIMVMSPITAEPLAPVSKKVMDAKIPLVLLDRTISTEDYSTFVGGDNTMIGKIVAEDILKKLNGKEGNIVEIQGTLGASATTDRHKGFMDAISKEKNVKVISNVSGEYDRAKAMSIMEDIIQTGEKIAAVYCHNDAMAMGAMTALQAAGVKDVAIYGADGSKEAFDEIKKGTITGTAFYPTGSTKAVEVIQDILAGKTVDRKYLVDVPLVTKENVDKYYDQGI